MIIGIEAAAPKCSVLPPQFALTLNGRLDVRESEVLGNCGSYQPRFRLRNIVYYLFISDTVQVLGFEILSITSVSFSVSLFGAVGGFSCF
jgi:hypothetical protein